jgi:lactoylglutathione lyase
MDRKGNGDFDMRYLHTMIRVYDLERSLRFFEALGLKETRRHDHEQGRYTLVFLSTGTPGDTAELELTHNWDQQEPYSVGRNFGHVAYQVDDIYVACARLEAAGIDILRPPRDGRMAFVRSPDQLSVELLQKGPALPPREPWHSRPNRGEW